MENYSDIEKIVARNSAWSTGVYSYLKIPKESQQRPTMLVTFCTSGSAA